MNKTLFLDLLFRLPLGLVFICAALEKIADPAAFALTIEYYRLFPAWSVAPLALILPWVEMWAGAMVFTGVWKRPAALVLAGLLASFLLAVGFNLYRGLDFECGCFGGSEGGRRAGWNLMWQDGLLLICALMVIRGRREGRST